MFRLVTILDETQARAEVVQVACIAIVLHITSLSSAIARYTVSIFMPSKSTVK
jgi:hypothetical protein